MAYMKEDILIYGVGEMYKKYSALINKHYNIVLYLDEKKNSDDSIEGRRIFHPNEADLNKYSSNKVLIMTEKYYTDISDSLLKCGVSQGNIVNGVKICRDLSRREDLKNDPLARQLISMPLSSMSRKFGLERGSAIDRIYIERFLNQHRNIIRGDVIEIAEDTYTRKYGSEINNAYILHVQNMGNGVIKGNLVTGEGIRDRFVDCAIITQTLSFLPDPKRAIINLYRMLKDDGNALITTAGISPLSTFDNDRWGHFWGFYERGIESLFASIELNCDIDIQPYGNVKMAMGFLYGMCAEDYVEKDFEQVDELYPLIYGIKMHKRICD